MNHSPIRILLVDDHSVVRAGLRWLLTQDDNLHIVGEASRGEEVANLYQTLQPDVVIMDLSLPGISGLETIRRLCLRDPEARVLAFSIHDENIYIERTLSAGALGYVPKNSAPELLVRAVYAVARGEYCLPSQYTGSKAISPSRTELAIDRFGELSAREFEIFCLLAEGHTTRQISQKLSLSYKTVANYSTLIRSKLGASTTAELARLAYEKGLLTSLPS